MDNSTEIEHPVLREQLKLEPFTDDERTRLMEVTLDEAFMNGPTRRVQIAAAHAIRLHDRRQEPT
jgi:truncated hemoglobin YjbI